MHTTVKLIHKLDGLQVIDKETRSPSSQITNKLSQKASKNLPWTLPNCHHLFHYGNLLKQKSLKLLAPSHKEIKSASGLDTKALLAEGQHHGLSGLQRLFQTILLGQRPFRWVLT